MNNNKDLNVIFRLIFVLVIGLIIISSSTFAYLSWTTSSSQRTNIAFTVTRNFTCSVDGGGDISSAKLAPIATEDMTSQNSDYFIKRTVKVTTEVFDTNPVYMDLWMDISKMGVGLTNSSNLRYILNTDSTSPTGGTILSTGNFYGKGVSDKLRIFNGREYTSTKTDTFYLWIWLDAPETSTDTMDQEFTVNLNGMCNNDTQPLAPTLDSGLIPVTIANDGTVQTTLSTNATWYDYDDKEWANAILVNDTSRSTYQNTDGVLVNESDIMAYYVWIPRYSYQIPYKLCSSLTDPNREDNPECYGELIMVDDATIDLLSNYMYDSYIFWENQEVPEPAIIREQIINSLETREDIVINYIYEGEEYEDYWTVEQMIWDYEDFGSDYGYTTALNYEYEFLGSNPYAITPVSINIAYASSASDAKLLGDGVNSFRTHPAFTFGTDELDGIWVGKFETSTNTDSICYTSPSAANCILNNVSPRILPNVSYLRWQNVSTQFQTALKFTNYGLTSNTDAHMMKNSEWGAVAYLSHSKYGINYEIRINNTESTTGCGASTENASRSSACPIQYGNATSYPQSTTGNISGIFDMSGGAWEYMMSVLVDDDGNLLSGNSSSKNSGFNGLLYDGSTYQSGIDFPDRKYYDLYTSVNSKAVCDGGICYGQALSETGGWYADYGTSVVYSIPWITRGGSYNISNAGAFAFEDYFGSASFLSSFRSVVSIP